MTPPSPKAIATLLPLALLAIAILIVVEASRREHRSPYYDDMLEASRRSARAADVLRDRRLERGVFVDAINDPSETGLIGQEYTQITTDRGYLEAKLESTNPNFAAVAVNALRTLKIDRGDCVAVAMTGSFPALNVSVLAAIETLELQPFLISSVGASNFGANDPYFTWLDMERDLQAAGAFATRSAAASLGGGKDIGRGLAPLGRKLLRDAVERNGVRLIHHSQLEASIDERLKLYREACGSEGPAVYINVGGGVASLGHSLNSSLIPAGLVTRLPLRNYPARGVMVRFGLEGVPVLHLLNIERLRDRYGLTSAQDRRPSPGEGRLYGEVRYSVLQTAVGCVLLIGILSALFVLDRQKNRLGTLVVNPKDTDHHEST